MVEAGKMRLIETIPGESGPLLIFETVAGDRFSIVKSAITQVQEAALIEQFRVLF